MTAPLPIDDHTQLFVLTGAGISAESGIATFRDAGGLWENHKVEEVASPLGFAVNPELVWRFYGARRKAALAVAPNAAHHALAKLAARLGDRLFLATQNVDPLHQKAAQEERARHQANDDLPSILCAMHGELFKTRCSREACTEAPFYDERCDFEELPRCPCGSLQRPHIVWFGEIPFEMHTIKRRVQACSLFVTIGSSGAVYPAAGLVREIRYRQSQGEAVRSVYVGLERPENADSFDELHLGRATEIVPALLGV